MSRKTGKKMAKGAQAIQETPKEQVKPHDIVTELEGSFLDYSMSVIVSRALPDARDGLKPVQRRILVTMHDEGLVPGRPFKKSAAVVGSALAKYHPHGDSSVYDAMVRQAQPWVMNEPLVDGQGNFGSNDNDPAAAYRYTEARMTQMGGMMLKDLDKNTVDFIPNFDGSRKEPVVLPSVLPNLLLNGSEGIAVGMATKIPPHNLRELGAAIEELLKDPEVSDRVLFNKVKGPDFPTGGFLLQTPEIKELYKTGRGKLTIRSRAIVERAASGRVSLVITEMPYMTAKAPLLEKLAQMVKEDGEAPGTGSRWTDVVATIRDESDRDGMRAVIELKKNADPARVLNALYKKTDLQVTYGAQMIALVEGAPKQLGLREALSVYVKHRMEVVIRRTKYDLEKAEARAHIVDGLLIAVGAIDEVVKILKKAKSREDAKSNLRKTFSLSDIQAEAILQMRLASLTGLDVAQLKDEKVNLARIIKELKRILASEEVRRQVLRDELKEGMDVFGRARRTEIVAGKIDESGDGGAEMSNSGKDPVPSNQLTGATSTILLGDGGNLKIISGDQAKGRAKSRIVVRGAEQGIALTSKGRAFPITGGASLAASGNRWVNGRVVLPLLDPQEEVVGILSPAEHGQKKAAIIFTLANGMIKKLDMAEIGGVRNSGLVVTKVETGDKLLSALVVQEKDEIMLFSKLGKVLRTPVAGIPAQGRAARGVAGIKLAAGDEVVSSSVAKGKVGFVTSKGFGRQSALDEFPTQGRGSSGVWLYRPSDKTGNLVTAAALADGSALSVKTSDGERVLSDTDLIDGTRAAVPKSIAGIGEEVKSGSAVTGD